MKKIIIGLCMICFIGQSFAQSTLPFEKNDRVAFAGNSITEAGLYVYDIWLYYATRFPNKTMEIINAGVGGDVSKQIYNRLEGDVLRKKPNVLVVTFGMNDSRYHEYNDRAKTNEVMQEAIATSKTGFDKIVTALDKEAGIRKIIMTSPPYDETVNLENNYFPGKSKTMEGIIAFQREKAKAMQWEFLDIFHPMNKINQEEQRRDPSYTLIGPDRIHPGSAGHLVMAYLFLKEQGLAGVPVARTIIDAGRMTTLLQEHVRVTKLKKWGDGLQFAYLADALPFPIDTVSRVWENFQTQRDALGLVPFMQDFNQENLTVQGLASGIYDVRIDGVSIAEVSAEDLSKGINLAEKTHAPQYKQAERVQHLLRQHRELVQKYRNYYWVNYNFLQDKGMLFEHSQQVRDSIDTHVEENIWLKFKREDYETVRQTASRKKLDADIAKLQKEIYRANKPVNHRVMIRRIDKQEAL